MTFADIQGLETRRRLPGRTGPPGLTNNTLPAFKPLGIQLMAFYWHHGHHDYVNFVRSGLFHRPGAGFRDRIDGALYAAMARRFENAMMARPH